jgi:outer membrane lipoprotein-sorting protein
MKKNLTSWKAIEASFILFLLAGCQTPVRTIEDVLARYYQVMGGVERLRAWKGMYVEGKYILVSQGGMEVPVRAWYRPPDKKRYEMSPPGGATAVYAFDGENAWYRDPSNGVLDPAPMPEAQARLTKENADEYPFIDYSAKGHHVELLGTEEFEGRRVFRVKLIRNTGVESFHLFDAESGREVKIIQDVAEGEEERLYETVLRDFRSVDGIELPFLSESWVGGQLVRKIQMERVEIDPVLDDSLFRFPGGS